MLEQDYSEQFSQLAAQTAFEIELPTEWQDYFSERGEVVSYGDDQRQSLRLKVRTHGLLFSEQDFGFCRRGREVVGIYTRDFSRKGVGLLTPVQFFPEEVIRVVLPTFWIHARVVRVRRVTSKCYELGTSLLRRHDPSRGAFLPPDGTFVPPQDNHADGAAVPTVF